MLKYYFFTKCGYCGGYKIFLMANITFRVRNRSIYYRFRNGRKLDSTRKLPFEVKLKNWSIAKQLFKNDNILNKELNNFKFYLLDQFNISVLNNELINLKWLADKQGQYFIPEDDSLKPKNEEITLLNYLRVFKKSAPEPVVKKLKTLEKKIAKLPSVNIENVDIHWISAYSKLYLSKGYAESSVSKQTQLIKRIIRFADLNDLPIKRNIFSYKSSTPSTISHYLNEDEIELLFNLRPTNALLNNVRKLFLIGCHTGLRVSDLMRIQTFYIDDEMIELVVQKTKQSIIIPIPKRVLAFIDEVSPISTHEFNWSLKLICEEAGISKKVRGYVQGKRNKRKIEYREKYHFISSHCMRRSFCTNLYTKIPTPVIMAISGHKTETNFLKYIKKPQRIFAEQLKEYYNQKYSTAKHT